MKNVNEVLKKQIAKHKQLIDSQKETIKTFELRVSELRQLNDELISENNHLKQHSMTVVSDKIILEKSHSKLQFEHSDSLLTITRLENLVKENILKISQLENENRKLSQSEYLRNNQVSQLVNSIECLTKSNLKNVEERG